MIPERFTLAVHERTSPTWKRLEQHMINRMALLRAQNDAPATPERTADIRGRIAMLKEILSLGEEPRTPKD